MEESRRLARSEALASASAVHTPNQSSPVSRLASPCTNAKENMAVENGVKSDYDDSKSKRKKHRRLI